MTELTAREAFGKTVRELRLKSRMFAYEFARFAGVSYTRLFQIERGDPKVSPKAIARISKQLGIFAPTVPPSGSPYGPIPRFPFPEGNEPDPYPGVYVILNRVNGMAYVGCARNVKKRWVEHSSGRATSKKLQRALEQYNHCDFVFVSVFYGGELDWRMAVEAMYMRHFNSVSHGYNDLPAALRRLEVWKTNVETLDQHHIKAWC